MKKILFLSCFLLTLFSFRPAKDCGEYRFDYKILIDEEGLALFNKPAQPSTVQELVAIQRPRREEMHNRRADEEKRVVKVTALIIALGKEDDGDYHLVLKSITGNKTLIAEIPDPTCEKLQSFPGLREKYTAARAFVQNNINAIPNSIKPLDEPIKVRITGAIFFDKMAHGNGHAENGIEIHPVLAIRKG